MASQSIISRPSVRYGTNKGVLDIRVAQSATTAAGASVWAVRNATAGKVIFITKIWIQLSFLGTGAATSMVYELIKGTGCTAMSGGSAVTALLKKAGVTNPDVDARVLDTGLTQTSISQGAAFWNMSHQRVTNGATQTSNTTGPMVLLDFSDDPIELVQNEVLSLRQAATSVIGDTVRGGVEFHGG